MWCVVLGLVSIHRNFNCVLEAERDTVDGGESLPLSQLWRPSYLVFSSFVWRWANYLPYLKVKAEMCPDREGLDQ